jgi:DNA-binding transcriptional LysR family regulator
MIALAAAGNGCCIVPEYARQFTNLGVVCRPLAAAQIERTLAIIKRKSRDGLAEAFFQFAVAQVSRLVPRLQVARMQAAASLYQADSMPSMAGGG